MEGLPLRTYSLEYDVDMYHDAFAGSFGIRRSDTMTLSTELRVDILHAVSTEDCMRILGTYYGGYAVLRRNYRTGVVTIAYFKNIIDATNHIRTFESVNKELDKEFRKIIKDENARRF